MEVKKPGTGACGGLAAARLARGMKHEDTARRRVASRVAGNLAIFAASNAHLQ